MRLLQKAFGTGESSLRAAYLALLDNLILRFDHEVAVFAILRSPEGFVAHAWLIVLKLMCTSTYTR